MSCLIRITTWHGLETHVLENDRYEAIILPDYGANCIALRDKDTGMPLLREPADSAALVASAYIYGLPILFPPNRVRDGVFTFQGREYVLPINDAPRNSHIHGLLAKMRFEPQGEGRYVYEATAEQPYITFGHTFKMERRYALTDEGLTHEIVVTNTSAQDMPLAVGMHTAYAADETDTLHIPVCSQIDLDDNFLPTGSTQEENARIVSLREGTLATEMHELSDQFTVAPGVWIMHRGALNFCFEPDPAFRFLMLWNQGGHRSFVCPEPQTCAVNAFKQVIPSQDTGADVLPAGESRSWRMRFFVRH